MAAGLFERLKADNRPVWDAYTRHEFVAGLQTGDLPEAAFQYYLKQDYLFLIQFARAYALAIYKADNLAEMRSALAGVKAILEMEMELHVGYCADWGIAASELESLEEAPENIAYTRFVLERGMAGDLLDLMVALSPCAIGYGEIGARLAKSRETKIEGNPYITWIEMYAGDDYQQLVADMAAEIDALAVKRFTEARFPDLSKTFATATKLEADFWQMGLTAL
ncbi:thiaminase II [Sneathiella chungangensis]|uniref:Aminopyrimidine aminohydrolase n=1 Tax=Sneathiella chungangensis TaxID=1418234 RepID=A0A845MB63_9PROT|nr:thiaminase II [Sneathiella chungangensis]MZR21368.1 thiaminase II [Sneathiella chungangensis]